jgi:hypothetical protein
LDFFEGPDLFPLFSPPPWLGLLRTCRQINHEAALIPFSVCIFRFSEQNTFGYFVESISEHHKEITSLRLEFTTWWDMHKEMRKSSLTRALPSLQRVDVLIKSFYGLGQMWMTVLFPVE